MSDPQASTAAPGWYPDQAGYIRWWDGQAWGPLAGPPPPPPLPAPNKAIAVLSHLGPFLGGFILPLVLYLVTDPRELYGRHHSSEGLNFALSVLVVEFGALALFFVGFGVMGVAGSSGGAIVGLGWFFLIWLGLLAMAVTAWVFAVIGAIQASKGVWWRYPICYRFVKGAAPKDTPPLIGF
jgi:uncharacterized protein